MRPLFLAFAAAAAIQAPAPAPDASRPPDAVVIDVIATNARGQAVETLKPSEFVLREDGDVQPIQDVRFVKADGNARLFAIFLDEYYVSAGRTAGGARRPAPFRRSGSPSGRPGHDPPAARFAVVDSPDARPRRAPSRDRRVRRAPRRLRAADRLRAQLHGRTTRRTPRSSARNRPGRRSTRSRCTSRNLGTGRKTMLLVSEQADPMLRRRGLESLPTSSSVMRTANRANVAIYVLDPLDPAARAAAPDEGPNLLSVLADDTDGVRFAPSTGASGDGPRGGVAPDGRRRVGLLPADVPLGAKYRRDVPCRRRIGEDARACTCGRARDSGRRTPDEIQRANLLARANEPRPPIVLAPARRISPLIRPWFGMARARTGTRA